MKLPMSDPEDQETVNLAQRTLERLSQLPIDPRLRHMLELLGEEDREYERGGLTYSVDGLDVSVSWGEPGALYILYLQADTFIFVAKGEENDDVERLKLQAILENPAEAMDFSELLGAR